MTDHVVHSDILRILGIGHDKVVREELGDGRVPCDIGVLGVVLDEQGDRRRGQDLGGGRNVKDRVDGTRRAGGDGGDAECFGGRLVALDDGHGQARDVELVHELLDLGVKLGRLKVVHLE